MFVIIHYYSLIFVVIRYIVSLFIIIHYHSLLFIIIHCYLLLSILIIYLYLYSYFIFTMLETLLFYSLFCSRFCISSFVAFSVFLVSHITHAFYANVPAFYAKISCYLGFYTRGEEGLVCLGFVLDPVRVFRWTCSLTCQPDS